MLQLVNWYLLDNDCLRLLCTLKHGTEECPGLIGSKKERVSGIKKSKDGIEVSIKFGFMRITFILFQEQVWSRERTICSN